MANNALDFSSGSGLAARRPSIPARPRGRGPPGLTGPRVGLVDLSSWLMFPPLKCFRAPGFCQYKNKHGRRTATPVFLLASLCFAKGCKANGLPA